MNATCNRLLVFRNESIINRDLRKLDCASPIILNVSDRTVNLLFIFLVNNLSSVLKRVIPL